MQRLEILRLDDECNGYLMAHLAYDGRLVVPFEFPKSVRFEEFPDESSFHAYLERQAQSLLDQFGDIREQRAVA